MELQERLEFRELMELPDLSDDGSVGIVGSADKSGTSGAAGAASGTAGSTGESDDARVTAFSLPISLGTGNSDFCGIRHTIINAAYNPTAADNAFDAN